MSQLCFATFAAALQRALLENLDWWNSHVGTTLSRTNKTVKDYSSAGQHYTVVRLLDWVRILPDVVTSEGEPIFIDDALASNWMNQTTDINKTIKDRIRRGDLDAKARAEFADICDELDKYKVNDFLQELCELISNDPAISQATKDELLELRSRPSVEEFLAQTFIYACIQPNKQRVEDLGSDDGWLVTVEENRCPVCRKRPLTKADAQGTVHLYEPIEFPVAKGSTDTARILLCATCAKERKFKETLLDGEPTGFDELRQVYEGYLLVQKVDEIYDSSNLYAGVRDVVLRLVERPTDEQLKLHKPEDWEAKAVERKILPQYWGLHEQIKTLADTFYFFVADAFSQLDDGGKRRFKRIRDQVGACYAEVAEVTGDQPLIFRKTTEWIASRAEVPTNDYGALIVAAFFVQNCEVFDEIP